MQRGFWAEKRTTQLAHGSQCVAEHHLAKARGNRLAPGGIRLAFFINRNAFAKPARHFVVCLAERDDVAEFVPQRCLPARWAGALRCGAIRRNDGAEADSQESSAARQAERANRK